MRAYCDKESLDRLLDGRKYKWLLERLQELDIKIEQNNFSNLINNRVDWRLTYAMGVAKVLNVNIDKLFYLK